MSKIAEVLAFERDGTVETVKVDPGGGANETADHCTPPGDDSPPLPGDFAELKESTGKGRDAAVGYTDPKNTREASPGEKRWYARDAGGNVVCSGWLKGDGTIVLSNANLTITGAPDGTASISAPEVRLGASPGAPVARRGEPVATVTPKLISGAPGSPCIPVPPTAITPSGNYVGTGVVISGASTVKAGP